MTSPTEKMLRDIKKECGYTQGYTGKTHLSPRVMEAMGKVRRDQFVPDNMKPYAYDNGPLPIGNGQTISQPFIVALMTDLLEPEADDVILEIGAGSGYQAAVLAELVRQVYSVEIIPALAARARNRLQQLGYANVEVLEGDGYRGLPAHAPYDGIIVTAAAPHIPPALVEQLRPNARLVIPVGPQHLPQSLLVVGKNNKGGTRTRQVMAVSFVPFTGTGQQVGGRTEKEY